MARKDLPAARERRMRRAAARMGLTVRKFDQGKERGRFQLIDADGGSPKTSPDHDHPNSFSLEQAESYVEGPDA